MAEPHVSALAALAIASGVGVLATSPEALARWLPLDRAASWRNRLGSLSLTLGFLLGTRALLLHAGERANTQYLFVVTLGYGHLLGAAWFSRARLATMRPASVPAPLLRAFVATGVLSLLALYTRLLQVHPAVIVPLLSVAAWHTVENDLLLAHSYARGQRIGPIPRDVGRHGVAFGTTFVVLLLGARTPAWVDFSRGLGGLPSAILDPLWLQWACVAIGMLLLLRRGLGGARLVGLAILACGLLSFGEYVPSPSLADLFVLVTLYHLVSWLVFFADRARERSRAGRSEESRAIWRQLAWVHLPAAVFSLALLAWPSPAADRIREILIGPAIYLFWAALHIVQTAFVRGVEPGSSTAFVPAPAGSSAQVPIDGSELPPLRSLKGELPCHRPTRSGGPGPDGPSRSSWRS